MKSYRDFQEIWLCTQHVDFRKQIQGLASIVQSELELNPFQSALFVFVGRTKDKIRLLHWDKTGFAMWSKQLEKSRFPWPRTFSGEPLRLTEQELGLFLDGFNIWKLKPHQELHFEPET